MEKTSTLKKYQVDREVQKEAEKASMKKLSEIDLARLSNTSGIEPLGYAVLVLPYKPDLESSPIYIPEEVSRQVDMYEMRGIVVAIGPDAFPWWRLWEARRCRVGDKVMMSKFCGAMLRGPLDDIQYRMVNAKDIFAVIRDEREVPHG